MSGDTYAGIGWEGGCVFETQGEAAHYGAEGPGDGEVGDFADGVAWDNGGGRGGKGFDEVAGVHLGMLDVRGLMMEWGGAYDH